MQSTQAEQVHVTTIHDVEGARLDGQRVEPGDVTMTDWGRSPP